VASAHSAAGASDVIKPLRGIGERGPSLSRGTTSPPPPEKMTEESAVPELENARFQLAEGKLPRSRIPGRFDVAFAF